MTPFQFFRFAVAQHRIKVFFIFFGDLLQAAFALFMPFAVKDLIDALVDYDAAGVLSVWDAASTPFMILVLAALGVFFGSRLSGTVQLFLAPKYRVKPRLLMVDHLQSHSINFFSNRFSGALGSKINDSMNGLALGTFIFCFDVWPVLVKGIVAVILVYMTDMFLGAVTSLWLLIYFIGMTWGAIRQYRISETIAGERAKITGSIVDLSANIQSVKSFSREGYEREIIERDMKGEIKHSYRFGITREAIGWFHSIMSTAIILGVVYHIIELHAEGQISLGEIAFIFTLLFLVTEQARNLLWGVFDFLQNMGQMADGVNTIMRPHRMQDKEGAQDLSVTQGDVTFDHVGFAYPEMPEEQVLDGFTLSISAGQKLGLVGKSGAGKTTLANLLLRFYDVQSGAIRIDGQNIADATQASLRSQIAVIPQDTSLFHRTLMENIRYGRLDATDEEVVQAAKQAFADEFIQKLPDRYDTMVGERGVKLSGGQRQRIAIARAILKDSPILILDEATSALDSESEQKIQASLKDLMQGKTVIAIAHRLSTIAGLDRLIMMERGRIVEDGTHQELLDKNGAYAKLWQMQSGGFIT